ncbi:MAG: hypothetical protein H5T62_12130, partial [Anaerolineae bacterium]|nr:hypothetical protein [Anaerolineae bacterium]
IRDYPTRMSLYRAERDALEAEFLREAEETYAQLRSAKNDERAAKLRAFTASCFQRATEATARWIETVSAAPIVNRPPLLFSLAWNGFNKQAHFT